MSQTLVDQILEILKTSPGKKYKASELAVQLIQSYPSHYAIKAEKTNVHGDSLVTQVSSEIGARKYSLEKLGICWDDEPRPRRYYYPANSQTEDPKHTENLGAEASLKEKDLYQPLMRDFLAPEMNLSCMRISESASKNNLGAGGNKWLHPDIVAMQRLDRDWCTEVKNCLGESSTAKIKLWSFEVKKDLNMGNFREAFFQTVSNSSWANEGYLVATSIAANIEADLRMLSSLHGIGVIMLKTDCIEESGVLLSAHQRQEVDWQSVNRIAEQNSDFKEFLKKVYAYIKSDYYDKNNWNS